MALQEGARVASGTVEALKSQPLALALIVINVLFLGAAIWLFHEVASATRGDQEHRNTLMMTALTTCGVKIVERVEDHIDGMHKDVQRGFDQLLQELRKSKQ